MLEAAAAGAAERLCQQEAVSARGCVSLRLSQPRSLVASVGPAQARKGSWMEWVQEGKGEEWQNGRHVAGPLRASGETGICLRMRLHADRSSPAGRGGSKMQDLLVPPWT